MKACQRPDADQMQARDRLLIGSLRVIEASQALESLERPPAASCKVFPPPVVAVSRAVCEYSTH